MKQVGYLQNTRDGLEGENGLFYDYVLAKGGLYIRAQGALIRATIQIATVDVRGLEPLNESVKLMHGKIPWRIYILALASLATNWQRETYLAVTWEGEYRLRQPVQDGEPSGVTYSKLPHTVLDIHSHGTMGAFFSGTDNRDEQGLCLYAVVGDLDRLFPTIKARVGVYGYFIPLSLGGIFEL